MATDKPNTEDSAKNNQQPELNAVLDKGGEVREGEELDAQAIAAGYETKASTFKANLPLLNFQAARRTGLIA